MEFSFETVYDQKALTAMARALRKTLRRKRSRRTHLFGWVVAALALWLSFLPGEEGLDARTIFTWAIVVVLVLTMLWEDAINGFFARKRMLPGTEKATAVFRKEEYVTTTEAGTTQWHYDRIAALAETTGYFVFVFHANHAQVYDKSSLTGGSLDAFRKWIEEATGRMIQAV